MNGPLYRTAYGSPDREDLPEFAELERAVILGGEGGDLTLLGPRGGSGPYFALRRHVLEMDDAGEILSSYISTEQVSDELFAALDDLTPHWRALRGVHVAPRHEAAIRDHLARHGIQYDRWFLRPRPQPMRCQYAWPACDAWPDGKLRDGFWIEGHLDQARELVGRLSHAHQQQIENAPDVPFGVLVSRDGAWRLGLEFIYPHSTQWGSPPFISVPPFEAVDENELLTVLASHPNLQELVGAEPDEAPCDLQPKPNAAGVTLTDRIYLALLGSPEPLHVSVLTQQLLADGWKTNSADPQATVRGALSVAIKRGGEHPPFVRSSPGHYALAPNAKASLSYTEIARLLLDAQPEPQPVPFQELALKAVTLGLLAPRQQEDFVRTLREIAGEDPTVFYLYGAGDLIGLTAWQDVRLPQLSTMQRLLALSPADFLEVATMAFLTFQVDTDVEQLPGPVIHLQGVLDLGHGSAKRAIVILLSAWVEQRPLVLNEEDVQALRDELPPTHPGMIITTGTFTPEAEREANDCAAGVPVGLVPGDMLVEIVEQFDLLAFLENA